MEGRDGKHSFQVQFKLNLMAACRVSLESIRMRLGPLVYDMGGTVTAIHQVFSFLVPDTFQNSE